MFFTFLKIDWGIYLIVFFLPIYLIKTNIFGVPTTVLEIAIYLLFIIWFLQNFPRQNLLENIREWIGENKLLVAGIFLLLAGAVISAVLSSDFRTSAGILKGWFFDPFLFFIILISTIKTMEQKENILKAFFASGLTVAAISLAYWFMPSLGGVSYDNRLHAFYLSPNHLAMYLAPALLIIFNFQFSIFNKFSIIQFKKKFFLNLSFLIVLISFYLTYSYAAWFALAVSLSLLIWFLFKSISFKKKILLFATCYLLLAILLFSQLGTSKFESLKNLSYRSSLNSRLMIWQSALAIGRDYPVFGIGPGNFQKYYLNYQAKFSEPYLEWAVPQPHNIFLAFWLQTGILGLAGFLILLFWFFRLSVRNFEADAKVEIHPSSLLQKEGNIINFPPLQKGIKEDLSLKKLNLSIILMALMVYTIAHGLFDTTYWKNDLAVIFWLNLGLLSAIKK